MKKSLLCLTSVFLLALACPACFPAAAQEAGPAAGAPSRPEAGGPSRMGTGDVKPPVRSEDGVFLRPNMESSVMISDLEQQLLEDQRSGISRTDRRRAREDRARRESYASWENGMIDSNYKQFKGVAEGEKSRHPSSGEKALERIRRIEKMKGDILRFERYYDEDSAEAQSLLSSLEDYYAELEGDTYVANSFAGELIVRGLDYDGTRDGWKITVYSELFGLASLFKFVTLVDYKELVKKGGTLQGMQGLRSFGGNEKDMSVRIIDSLLARTVPVLFATLEYRVVRGTEASQYRLVPLSLTLARTDSLKLVFSAGRGLLPQGTFYMTPRLAVRGSIASPPADGGQDTGRGGGSGGTEAAGGRTEGGPSPDGSFSAAMLSRQKKRRVILFTADTAVRDADAFALRNLDLNAIRLSFEFANKEYFFYGGGLSWRYMGRNTESFYGAFVNGGANITLFRNFRPYLQLEASANTGAELGLGFGAGLDFTIKRLLLNVSGGYNWIFDADSKDGSKYSNFAAFGIGIGYTW